MLQGELKLNKGLINKKSAMGLKVIQGHQGKVTVSYISQNVELHLKTNRLLYYSCVKPCTTSDKGLHVNLSHWSVWKGACLGRKPKPSTTNLKNRVLERLSALFRRFCLCKIASLRLWTSTISCSQNSFNFTRG